MMCIYGTIMLIMLGIVFVLSQGILKIIIAPVFVAAVALASKTALGDATIPFKPAMYAATYHCDATLIAVIAFAAFNVCTSKQPIFRYVLAAAMIFMCAFHYDPATNMAYIRSL